MSQDVQEKDWPDECGQCGDNPHGYHGGYGTRCECGKFLCHTCSEEGYDGDDTVRCEKCEQSPTGRREPTAKELEDEGQQTLFKDE